MDIEKQVRKAATLISQLREVDTDFRVFGAESHRYRIGPPLSEEELHAFEVKHGIELPPDYRLYLQTVGNGNGDLSPLSPHEGYARRAGAGPHYGLYRLGDVVGEHINEPFPLVQEGEIEPTQDNFGDHDIPGKLDLNSQGCSDKTHIVMKGATYGTIWESTENEVFWPISSSFIEWICDWAEQCIPLVILTRVANPVVVGMTLNEVISLCGDNGCRPYSLRRWGSDSVIRHLQFENIATHFEIVDDDIVTCVIKHSISPRLARKSNAKGAT